MELPLQALLEGLLYPSESDEPIEYLCIPYKGDCPISVEEFSSLFSLAPSERIVEREASRFWSVVTEMQEWYNPRERQRTEKFRALEHTLEAGTEQVQYFEAGTVEVGLYLLGFSEGYLHCLRTVAIRT